MRWDAREIMGSRLCYVVIAGHARLAAAKKLRMTEVPVIVLGHLTEAQRRALVIADNQLALNAAGMKKCFASSCGHCRRKTSI